MLLLFIGIILLIGYFGIGWTKTLKYYDCSSEYKNYYVYPYIGEYIRCYGDKLCEYNQDLGILNANRRIMKCLCQDKVNNAPQIKDFYLNHIKGLKLDKVSEFFEKGVYPYSIDNVCKFFSGEVSYQ